MAPRKRKAAQAETAQAASAVPAGAGETKARKATGTPDPTFTRVTRSATLKKGGESSTESKPELKKEGRGKGKAKEAKKKKKDGANTGFKEEEKPNDAEKVDAPAAVTGDGNMDSDGSKGSVEDGGAVSEVEESKEEKRTIVIEHCKQCNSFKTRAMQVKKGLEEAAPRITVHVNPDKPRRGCFEIREDGGAKFVSLLDMKRPFTPMKKLDMEKVISDIIEKIKC